MMRIRTYEGPPAASRLDVVLPVYAEVYAEPPYCEGPDDVAHFRDHGWPAREAAPGFRLAVATADEQVVGFTFGHELTADTRWWSGA
jgi:hypothetical protein